MRVALEKINKVNEYFTMTMMVLMVVVVFMQILSRAVIGSSFTWTEEVARFFMIWVIFLGSAIAFRYGSHISIEAVYNLLSLRWKKIMHVLLTLVCLAFCYFLITKGFVLTQKSFTNLSPALGIPMGYVYMIMPISGIIMAANAVDMLVQFLTTGEKPKGEEE